MDVPVHWQFPLRGCVTFPIGLEDVVVRPQYEVEGLAQIRLGLLALVHQLRAEFHQLSGMKSRLQLRQRHGHGLHRLGAAPAAEFGGHERRRQSKPVVTRADDFHAFTGFQCRLRIALQALRVCRRLEKTKCGVHEHHARAVVDVVAPPRLVDGDGSGDAIARLQIVRQLCRLRNRQQPPAVKSIRDPGREHANVVGVRRVEMDQRRAAGCGAVGGIAVPGDFDLGVRPVARQRGVGGLEDDFEGIPVVRHEKRQAGLGGKHVAHHGAHFHVTKRIFGDVELQGIAAAGSQLKIEASVDLATFAQVGSVVADATGKFLFLDHAGALQKRFYRAFVP